MRVSPCCMASCIYSPRNGRQANKSCQILLLVSALSADWTIICVADKHLAISAAEQGDMTKEGFSARALGYVHGFDEFPTLQDHYSRKAPG